MRHKAGLDLNLDSLSGALMRLFSILSALLTIGLTLACGGGGSSPRPTPTGSLTILFGSDSFPGYGQAVVSLEKVEGTGDGVNWIPFGNVKATFDLMALQNGHSAVILPATQVNAGTYTQFRITWATVNYQSTTSIPAYVYLNGAASGQVLSMPTTTVVTGVVAVPTNGNTTAQIMLSGQQAVQSRVSGSNTTYTFQATGGAYDLASSARITGHLESGTTPVAGAEVFAETLDGVSGLPTIQRRAFSDSSGNYILECLAMDNLYFVASQPVVTSGSYPAAAAFPVNASTATAYMANLAFSAPPSPGSLTLTITPASTATQGTWGDLRQNLSTGGTGSAYLIVRSQPVATGSQDQAGFLGLAPGFYGVTAQRSTSGAAPVPKSGATVLVSANVNATPPPLIYP
jgi:hypothetical protein